LSRARALLQQQLADLEKKTIKTEGSYETSTIAFAQRI
jgi:hypothetical protein